MAVRSSLRQLNRIALVLLLCSVQIALQGCTVTRVLERNWVEVRSENFTISSDMSAKDAERLARSLELFRAAVLLITSVRSLESRIPTRVFFFDSEATFRPFRSSRNIVGYFKATPRANFVAIVDARHTDAEVTLRHEYVHFLVRNGSARVYPWWYDEGFAELLSTAKQMGPYVAVGMIPEDRIRQFKLTPWIPLDEVMAYDRTQAWPAWQIAMSYAQSWALLHYLSRDFEHAAALAGSIGTYMDQIESGEDLDVACEAAFGMSIEALDKGVRRHLERGSFEPIGVRTDRLYWSEETHPRPLGRAEVAERLGELSLGIGKHANAESFFRAALLDDPVLARAHGGLGDILKWREQWSEAERHFARAVELAPDDPLNELDYGEYWLTRAHESEEPEARHELLERARPHLLRALELDEWKPEPWAIYGSTFLAEGEDPRDGIEWLEQGLQLLPSSTGIQLLLAEAYVAVDRKPEARALLARILSWSHEGPDAQAAHELLRQLERQAAPLHQAAPLR